MHGLRETRVKLDRPFEFEVKSNAMRVTFWCAVTALVFVADVAAADFGSRGGPEPINVDEIANVLRQDPSTWSC